MLVVKAVNEKSDAFESVQELYVRSFPENERRPLEPLMRDGSGLSELIAFYEGNCFCGFAALLNAEDITHIIYFAVEEKQRNRGIGSRALAEIKKAKAGRRIIVDIEAQREDADNNAQREKRKQFYFRNGYAESNAGYRWRGETYEILVSGGGFTDEDFEGFWSVMRRKGAHLLKQ